MGSRERRKREAEEETAYKWLTHKRTSRGSNLGHSVLEEVSSWWKSKPKAMARVEAGEVNLSRRQGDRDGNTCNFSTPHTFSL